MQVEVMLIVQRCSVVITPCSDKVRIERNCKQICVDSYCDCAKGFSVKESKCEGRTLILLSIRSLAISSINDIITLQGHMIIA